MPQSIPTAEGRSLALGEGPAAVLLRPLLPGAVACPGSGDGKAWNLSELNYPSGNKTMEHGHKKSVIYPFKMVSFHSYDVSLPEGMQTRRGIISPK